MDAPPELMAACENFASKQGQQVMLLPYSQFKTIQDSTIEGVVSNYSGFYIIAYHDGVNPFGVSPHFHVGLPDIPCYCGDTNAAIMRFATGDSYRDKILANRIRMNSSIYGFTFEWNKASKIIKLLAISKMATTISEDFSLPDAKILGLNGSDVKQMGKFSTWLTERGEAERKITDHEKKIVSLTTEIQKSFAEIIRYQQIPKTFVFHEMPDKVFSHPKIFKSSIVPNLRNLTVCTKVETIPLLYEFNKSDFGVALPIGKFTAEFDPPNSNIYWTDAPDISACHPHISAGSICWGGFGSKIIKHLSGGEVEFGSDELIQYLEMVDYNSKYRTWQQALDKIGIHMNESEWMSGVPMRAPDNLAEDSEPSEDDGLFISSNELETLRSLPTQAQGSDDTWVEATTTTAEPQNPDSL